MLKKLIAISLLSLSALSAASCDTLSHNSNNNSNLYAMYCDDANEEYYFYDDLNYIKNKQDRKTYVYKKDLKLFTLSYFSEYDLDNYAKSKNTDAGSSWWYSFDDLVSLGLTINKETKEAIYWGKWNERERYNV